MFSSVDSLPRGAEEHDEFVGEHVEVHAAQRAHVDFAHGKTFVMPRAVTTGASGVMV